MSPRRSGSWVGGARSVGVAVGALVVMTGGCASGPSRADTKAKLTAGADALTAEQADCVIDGLVARGISLERLEQPTTQDQGAVTQVLQACATTARSTGTTATSAATGASTTTPR